MLHFLYSVFFYLFLVSYNVLMIIYELLMILNVWTALCADLLVLFRQISRELWYKYTEVTLLLGLLLLLLLFVLIPLGR